MRLCILHKLDFLGNFRSTIFLVSFAPDFEPLPCNTYSIAAVESLCQAQNILRNLALLQFPRKSIELPKFYAVQVLLPIRH